MSKQHKAIHNRKQSSLHNIAKKFVVYIKSQPNYIANLKSASNDLQIRKRRIYDITNVLEGVGLVKKSSKNNVKWIGSTSSKNEEREREMAQLKDEIDKFKEEENELDGEIGRKGMEIESLKRKYEPFVTFQDIRNLEEFKNNTVIAVKLPKDTIVRDMSQKEENKLSVRTTSNTPIQMFLVSGKKDHTIQYLTENEEEVDETDLMIDE